MKERDRVCLCVCVSHLAGSRLGMEALWFADSSQLALLEQQHLRDVWEDTSLTYGHTSQQLGTQKERDSSNTICRQNHDPVC